MNAEPFGRGPAGEPVERLTISGGGMTAKILTFGAIVQDLRMEGHGAPLVLGFEAFEDYLARSPYFGALAGRYANRIRDGRFRLDGREFQLDTNFIGRHLLHGGARGTGKRLWRVEAHGDDFVRLELTDRDGEMGFPGNLAIGCTYSLRDGALRVELEATTDAPTLCNVAHHSYFNLDGGGAGDVLDHRLAIDAEAFVPVDAEWLPTGGTTAVAGTAFDFRTPRPIRAQGEGGQVQYDHNWCLSEGKQPLRRVARLEGAASGISMEVWTTEPGLQFYAGHKLAIEGGGLDGRSYRGFAGLCLEPQVWPDSPNQPGFPQAVLRPGERYRQHTEYRFAR